MEILISFTRSPISGTGWAVWWIPTRPPPGRADIPTRAFISMMSIFTTTVTLGIYFIPWWANRTGTSWRTILNSINHRTLLWLKWWMIFLPPVRRHWARRLCLGRAPLSPVRRLRSLTVWVLITTGRWTPPWRRIIQQSPTKYIKISKSDGIIITFVHPNTNINRHLSTTSILPTYQIVWRHPLQWK